MNRNRRHRPRNPAASRGLAAVELALVLPVFLILMLGTAELGRAIYQYNTLTKTVRTAARYLAERALNGAGVIDIQSADAAAARNLVVYGSPVAGDEPMLHGLEAEDVAVAAVDATHIQVSVDYAYDPVFLAIPTFGYTEHDVHLRGTLHAASQMRAL